jgi:putative oxidoreductase
MSKHLFKPDAASLVLRLGLGAIFIFHGFLKIAYGSASWNMELPVWLQMAVAWGEAIAGVAFLAGFLSRVAALGIIAIMIGAITQVTGKLDYMPMDNSPSWNGVNLTAVGYEYNVAIIVMAVSLILLGSGSMSVDQLLFGRKTAPAASPQGSAPPVPPAALPPKVHSGA